MDNKTYQKITLFSGLIIAFAFTLNSPLEIIQGLKIIISSRSDLTTDFFALANPGATLINGALLMLFANLYLKYFKVQLTGNTITAIVLMMTYGFFGKNLINVWPFIIGSFIYYKTSGEESSNTLPIGFLSTGLAPLVSYFNPIVSVPIAIVVGFIIVPCARLMPKLHKGLSMFNTGYALGIISTIIYQIMRVFNVSVPSRMVFDTNTTTPIIFALSIMFVLMIFGGNIKDYPSIIKENGVLLKDFYNTYGFNTALTNAGFNGILALLAVVLVGAPVNGVSTGCILIVSAFGFNGSTIKTILPIFAAFYLGHYFKIWNLHEAGPLMAMLLATSLAPFVGKYGVFLGIVASILVGLLAPVTNAFHGGLSLLNTGFACGLVVTALNQVLERAIQK